MKLLVINFEMDRLSRSMAWSQQVVDLLAERCDQVVVLTSRVGNYDPPANVRIELLPPRPWGIPQRLGSQWLLNFWVADLIRRYRLDACFIHMAMSWAYKLGPAFRLMQVPTLVWYAHGSVSSELRRAHRAATRIVTSTPEGFRLPSKKVAVIGQGVDSDLFSLKPQHPERHDLVTVSRITPRKQLDLLIEVMERIRLLPQAGRIHLNIIGTTVSSDDQQYELRLRNRIWDTGLQDRISFLGFVPHRYIHHYYDTCFLHINVSKTGSMDKTVLEALSCGCPVLTTNEAFFHFLEDYPEFVMIDDDSELLANRILFLYERRMSYDPMILRAKIVGEHDVHSYVDKILWNLHELKDSNP